MDIAVALVLIVFLLAIFDILLWAMLAVQVVLLILMVAIREWSMVILLVCVTGIEVLSFM